MGCGGAEKVAFDVDIQPPLACFTWSTRGKYRRHQHLLKPRLTKNLAPHGPCQNPKPKIIVILRQRNVSKDPKHLEAVRAASDLVSPGSQMVYKRDAFLNKCSMPAAGAALAPAGEAQIKGPKLPQPLAQASAQPPQLAATQGAAPSTAPSVAAAPSNTLTSWMPASWGGLSDKPLAHSLAPVSQPSMEPIASKRLPSVSLPAQGVAPKPSGVAAAPGPAPASGPGGSVREKVAASVAVPGSAWEAATPLRPSAGPSASFPELLPGKSAAGSGLRETAGTDSFSTKDSSEVVPASGPRSEAMVPSKPVEATPQTVSQTVYASQPTLAASRAEFPAAVPFLAPASVGPNAASPEGVYSTALEAATASGTWLWHVACVSLSTLLVDVF